MIGVLLWLSADDPVDEISQSLPTGSCRRATQI
jgi:hypothetical protein